MKARSLRAVTPAAPRAVPVVVLALTLALGAPGALAQTGADSKPPAVAAAPRKLLVCHATGAASNPYVTTSVDASDLKGHDSHPGDLIPAPSSGCPSAPPPPTCEEQNLPCESIPELPSNLVGLLAVLGAVGIWLLGCTSMRVLRGR